MREQLETEDKLIIGFAMVGIATAVYGCVWLVSVASLALSGNMYMVR